MVFAIADNEGYNTNNWFFQMLIFFVFPTYYILLLSPTGNDVLDILISIFIHSIVYSLIAFYSFKFLKYINNQLNQI